MLRFATCFIAVPPPCSLHGVLGEVGAPQGGSGEVDRSKCTMFGVDGRRIFMIVGNAHGALDELIMLDMQVTALPFPTSLTSALQRFERGCRAVGFR
jgi:hypothetical protein